MRLEGDAAINGGARGACKGIYMTGGMILTHPEGPSSMATPGHLSPSLLFGTQVVSLEQHIRFRSILPARDRASSLTLDLCLRNLTATSSQRDGGSLRTMRTATTIRLEARFTKVYSSRG